ncbi:MAG: AroM family protein [Oenococcus sp.]|uniref:AroM family protein n=1 Tax=Oenococcus sp. TaxID=1979414 RepID=UPI0039E98F4D
MAKQLLMLTIGQSPRTDVAPIIEENLGPDSQLRQIGALDGLSETEIKERISPHNVDQHDHYLLTSRLNNGHSVVMLRSKLQPLIQAKIDEAEAQGFTTIFLLCTGMFPGLNTRQINLVEPDLIIPPIVKMIVGDHRLGVIVPLKEQLAMDSQKYKKAGLKPIYDFASPYADDERHFQEVAHRMGPKVDYILMDCMGFNEHWRQIVSKESGKVVILSNALIAKVLSEFI